MNFKSIVIGTVVTASTIASSHAAGVTPDALTTIQAEVACEGQNQNSDQDTDCADVNAEFENLINSNNVETIYELYREKKVQMEMMYDGHTPTTR